MPAGAQQIHFYSEFQRFDPWGHVVPYDREAVPREVISPSIARNGHLSMHVVVTAPPGTNYFVYAAANPPEALQLTLYREWFVACGNTFCPDWITEQQAQSFGVIPESLFMMKGQTTRSYLLDIYARPGTPPGRIRVEAQLKVAQWYVAPLEVRVVQARVPDLPMGAYGYRTPVEAPASMPAMTQLQRFLGGLPPQAPVRLVRLSDITQRNAAEDMLMAPAGTTAALRAIAWAPERWRLLGGEWYLKVRDLLNR